MSTTELAVTQQRQEWHYRLGVMGGTFDPIHHGHLAAASEVAVKFSPGEVVLVPTGVPWQKTHRSTTRAKDRYLTTVIAIASNPRFSVSRVDIDRLGNTYTVGTLRDPHVEHGNNVNLFFITGADAVWQIPTWRDAEQLFDLAYSAGVIRPGVPTTEDDLARPPLDRVMLLEVPALTISSTDCRTRVQYAEPVWHLVPDGIVRHIVKRGFYLHPKTGVPADNI